MANERCKGNKKIQKSESEEGKAKGKVLDSRICRTRGLSTGVESARDDTPFSREGGKIAKRGNLQRRSKVENAVQLCGDVVDSPMHKHAATAVETLLNETIGRGEVL